MGKDFFYMNQNWYIVKFYIPPPIAESRTVLVSAESCWGACIEVESWEANQGAQIEEVKLWRGLYGVIA